MLKLLQILKIAGVVLFVLITSLAVWQGYVRGQKAAQGRQIAKDVKAIRQALEYFYNDQNRYPSNDEFADQNIMRLYASGYPPQEFSSNSCPKNYDYSNLFRNDYELRFCLPLGVKGYQTGWNVIKSPTR